MTQNELLFDTNQPAPLLQSFSDQLEQQNLRQARILDLEQDCQLG